MRANVDLGDKKIKSRAAKMIHSLNIPQKAVPADETRVKENQVPRMKSHPKAAPQKIMPRKVDSKNVNLKQVPKLKPPQQAAPQRIMPPKVDIGNENVKQESKLQPRVKP